MSTRERISELINEVMGGCRPEPPGWEDGQPLFADGIGLASLDFATLVVRLEQETGYDPFRAGDVERLPQTLGELVEIYEQRPGNGETTSQ
jgi:acyl carrier protein